MVRYLIKFTKDTEIKFVSHLDIMRTIQRVIRRADLPVEYSKGFNPHMSISIAQPLPVGIYSAGEYMDVVFTKAMSEFYIKDKFNEYAPPSIRAKEVIKVPSVQEGSKKIPSSMAVVDGAKYSIKIRYKELSKVLEDMKKLMDMREWVTLKKTKSGQKEADIKPMIKELNYSVSGDYLNINTIISCGSRENLSPELLSAFIQNNTSNCDMEAFVDIKREEIYGIRDNEYEPLSQLMLMFAR